AVWILGNEKAIDLTTQSEVGAVIANQVNAIRHPVVAQDVFSALQAVAQNLPETPRLHINRTIEIGRERSNGFDVDLEKQAVLASEMLEDGTLGNVELCRDVSNAGGMITVFREMLHRSIDNAGALGFRTGPRRRIPPVLRRRCKTAGDPGHIDLKSQKDTGTSIRISIAIFHG